MVIIFEDYLNEFRGTITEGNEKNGICFDGVVDKDLYFSSKYRLLLLLKETNGNDNNGQVKICQEDWHYMSWVHDQADGKVGLYRSVFRNIAMWARMFEKYEENGECPTAQAFVDENGLIINRELCQALKRIAIINLKKSWGTGSTDYSALSKYLEDDKQRKEIVKHQIRELKPSLVMCGGTFDLAKGLYEDGVEEKSTNGSRYFVRDSSVFVSCYHPSKPGWGRIDSYEQANNIFKFFFDKTV